MTPKRLQKTQAVPRISALRDPAYAEWVRNVAQRFRAAQIKAAVRVNDELLRFYWSIGRDIVEKRAESKYGDGFFLNFSRDLQCELPGVKGLSPNNLYYMKAFYLLYLQGVENSPQVVGNLAESQISLATTTPELSQEWFFQIPWGHHRTIIDKFPDDPATACFYLIETSRHGWSRAVLAHHIDTRLHERQNRAVTNFDRTLPDIGSDLAHELAKDPYSFDFTQLTETFTEKELKTALVANIEKFLLELGNGFAFMDREHRLEVAGTELFTDLLFYHVRLHCYVVVEVKTAPFEPAFLGQLSGYVSSANHLLKGPGDADTIGLLICKSKNRVLARYALEGYNQPLGISDFELAKLYPKDFRSSLPSIEELEAGLSGPPVHPSSPRKKAPK